MVLRKIQRHFVVEFLVLFILVSASAFTGSRSTPTCPRRTMLPANAPSTAWSAFGLESQLQCLGDGASSKRLRIRSTKTQSRTCRTALFARPKPSDDEMAERKEQLRDLLSATDAEIEKLVKKCKGILDYRDIGKSHGPKVAMLQERLGIDQKAAGKMCLNAHRLLTFKLETLVSKIDWLQARLNLSKTQLKTILTRRSDIVVASIDDNLQPSLENIQSGLELSDKELTEMVARAPDFVLYYNSTEKLAARLSLLQNLLNIEEKDVVTLRKTVKWRPEILHWSEERMLETQHWISQRLGLSDSRIAQMCMNYPYLLLANVTTLEDKIDWAQAAMSLSDEELGELFGKFPSLFGYCPKKNLEPKLRFLRLTFELNDEQLKELFLLSSSLFGHSENTIEEKLQFYSELVGESEARRIVMESTNLLKASLKKRLRPRLADVEKAGVKVVWTEQLIQRLARRRDDTWERYGLGEARRGRHDS